MQLYGTYSKIPLIRPVVTDFGFLPDDGQKYLLVPGASDEFNGTALDKSKFFARYHDNSGTLDHYNDELQRYGDGHVVRNGCLELTATPRAGTVGHPPSPSGIQYPLFDSQMIRSKTILRYGYIESRIKMPNALGAWPALWLLANGNWPGEYDMMEFAPNGVTEKLDMLHCGNVNVKTMQPNTVYTRYADANVNQQWGFWKPPAGFSPTYGIDDWHIFSTRWTPTDFTMYIDGMPIRQTTCNWRRNDNGALGEMASVIVNLAIGGSWAAYNFTTPVPTGPVTMLIDYVRVYQVEGQSQIGVATL
jgi:beta-glucanase (GH16 family)